MAGEWPTVTIEEIAERVAMGPFGSSIKVETFVQSGVPIISGQHLQGFKLDEAQGFDFITEKHADRLKNANVQRGDIVFTHAGNIGQVAYIPNGSKFERYVISQRQFYMRCDLSKVIPEYIVAYFKTPEGQQKLLANTSQVGVPSIAQPVTYLRTIEITLPPLSEQRAIAHILGTLDDKIELNRRMNETLEAIAHAIFKSWFVDFDPVRAKMDGRWKKGQSLPGLPAHLYDLFPERLVDSELGKIPKGWRVEKLSDLCSTQYGYTACAVSKPVGPRLLRVTDINKRNWIEWDAVPYCVISAEDKSKYALAVGDIVVARMADPGKSAIVEEEVDAVFASYLVRLRTESMAHSYYVYGFLKSDAYRGYSAAATAGSVQANMNAKVIVGAELVVPPHAVMRAYIDAVLPLRQKLVSNLSESRTLAALRDTLLPKLISGKLRVKDAEKFVEKTL